MKMNEWVGGVDLVFNNVGTESCGKLNEHDEWDRVINLDLWCVIHCCNVLAPHLKK
jgi:NAD(P)-dependent dehydrogenase (short-subunit alcohol dehydrogenase family)